MTFGISQITSEKLWSQPTREVWEGNRVGCFCGGTNSSTPKTYVTGEIFTYSEKFILITWELVKNLGEGEQVYCKVITMITLLNSNNNNKKNFHKNGYLTVVSIYLQL